jgi:hypothetical protein
MSTAHHQEYLNIVYAQNLFVMLVLLASASVVRMEKCQIKMDLQEVGCESMDWDRA